MAYPGRTPHIHFKIKQGGKELLTTQCYIKGEAANEKDVSIATSATPSKRESVTIDFTPIWKESKVGELAAVRDRARLDAGE